MNADMYPFAERSIAEARQSKHEEGRPSPFVGAVAVRDGRILETAFRGELGNGQHAEYTLLEGKLKKVPLAGAVVFTTLEPCTDRNPPKVPCFQRLIDRRVERVVIGMLDPNPMIRGKGVLKLRAAGIKIDYFPPDFTAQLEELNRDFIQDQLRKPDPLDQLREMEAQLATYKGLMSVSTGGGRSDAFQGIRSRAKQKVIISGVGMTQVSSYATLSIREEACSVPFDFLMMDPDYLDATPALAAEVQRFLNIRDFAGKVRSSYNALRELAEEVNAAHGGRRQVQLRVYSTLPTMSMVAVDPDEATGELIIEFFLYQSGEHRPRFHIRKASGDGTPFARFYRDYLRLWNSARIVI